MSTPRGQVRMFADEVEIDAALVRRLLARQFPHWAHLPLEPVLPMGTDNALYRIGDELVARLPRRDRTVKTLAKECRWLPVLAPLLPVAAPLPRAAGLPGDGYPFRWAVYTWLDGESATSEHAVDQRRLAADLSSFLAALWAIDASDGPPPGEHNFFRGEPLARRDEATRAAIASLAGTLDADAATATWEAALRAPEWAGPGVWIHGDLDARNLLVKHGTLSAVIDFGGAGVGDPACDAMVAWKVLSRESREHFRRALSLDDATWARARGWALSQAVGALSSYTPETNAVLVHEARKWLAAVLAEAS